MGGEAGFDGRGIEVVDVRVGDDGVPVGRRVGRDERSNLSDETRLDVNPGLAGGANDRAYQVTSPEAALLFARRARVNSRSERRFRYMTTRPGSGVSLPSVTTRRSARRQTVRAK